MRIRVLGALDLVSDAGVAVQLGSRTQRRLLALLALHAGSVVPADRIIDVLWGGAEATDRGNRVHVQVSRLRRAVGADAILTRAPGYLLSVPASEIDATVFADLVERARDARVAGRPADAAMLLDEALGLWRGGAYAEFADEDFARAEAARLDELRTAAEEDRVDVELAVGRPERAIARAEVLVAAHPLRERPHALLMLGLYRAGRQVEALEVYREYRDRLIDELGLGCSASLQQLEGRILRQDPALDLPTAAVPTAEPAQQVVPAQALARPRIGLVGRARDLAELTASLRSARVVTLVGAGGVGKTLLALHAAADLAGEFPDGARLVELAAVRDPAAVADAASTALGIQQRAGLDTKRRLVEFLRPKQLLLVLDNCEHVVDAAAGLVDAVVAGCLGITVLATSREPLGVAGEHVRPLAPLEVPSAAITEPGEVAEVPAVRLLLDRAAAVAPGFTLDAGNLSAVAEICRRLDGLPLAIELAAPRLRSMSPADVAARLDARFPLLRGVRRAGAERQRTLRGVVDWSYELLDDVQRRVFEWLSVFAGPFPLSAAERVCAALVPDPAELTDVVLGLADRSMVVARVADGAGRSRYALLETMRDYGRERLAERGDSARAGRTHAEWAVEVAESAGRGLQGAEEARWVEVVAAATDDLRAAHRWALDHDLGLAIELLAPLFWYAEFRSTEMLDWAERTIDAAERARITHPQLPVVYAMAGVANRFRGNLARTAALATTGVEMAGGGPAGWAARNLLADVAFFEGRLSEAEAVFVDLARDTEDAGERYPLTVALWMLALTRAYRGDRDTALHYARRAQAEARALANPSMIAWASYSEAEALLDVDPQRALRLLSEASALADTVGNRYIDGVARISAASVQARHGDPVQALREFRTVLARWHEAGGWTQLWTAMRSVIDLLTRTGAYEHAAVLYGAVCASATASPVFGADAERLATTLEVLRRELGVEDLATATRQGADLSDDAAVAAAMSAIDAASASRPIPNRGP